MSNLGIALTTALSTTALIALLGRICWGWLVERLRASIQQEHTKFLDQLQWERKIQVRAESVAEYLSIATTIQEDASEGEYSKLNQLGWELAMWLPDKIYRDVAQAVISPTYEKTLETVITVRRYLLGESAGSLAATDVVLASPGIGRNRL